MDNPEGESAPESCENRYRRLFETAQDGILILEEKSGTVIDANPFMIELLGYPFEALVGKELWEIGLSSDREKSAAAVDELKREGYLRYKDLPFETRNGERVDVEVVSNSYMEGKQRVIQCNIRRAIGRNVVNDAALISRDRFRFLAESIPLLTFTATPSGNIDYVNGQLTGFTGLSFEEICESGRQQYVHEDDAEESARRWRHSVETGEPFQQESRLRRADGVYRWHLTRACALRNAAGSITIWVGSSTDIDDRKRFEERLVRQYREAEVLGRAKDDFLAISSHELRTPLTSILGWSELLVEGDLDEVARRDALDTILKCARLQSRLIDDMLDVSRLLTGKLELNNQMVDVAAALKLAIRTITPAAENKNIRLEQSFRGDALRVYGDAMRIQQIFWNILSNAVKFTPPGGTVRIRHSTRESEVKVEVTDSGEGITADFLPFVFESLAQQGGGTTRRHGGLGLGLSIVKQLAEMHGGTVRAGSDGVGQGSTFTVVLPARSRVTRVKHSAARSLRPLSRPRRSTGKPISLAPMHVLVVDDEPDATRLIATVLEGAGASVVTALSAAEAFEQLSDQTFDVLISDIAMPTEDGQSLARRVRARDDEKASIPALAVTAYGGPLQRDEALSAGFDGYVKKPFAPRDLVRAVAVIARPEAEPGTSAERAACHPLDSDDYEGNG
jgi:PAS domain S-box-containing protein